MALLKQRNRFVVFRLTQEEYNAIKSACVAAGSRNLSDFTRTELLALIQADGRSCLVEQKLLEIDRKLADLQSCVERVSERMASPRPTFAQKATSSSA